ncbi:Indole-3-glycerol phosphate synthase protein [Halorhabdus tiamatea SARL4B]|uniref:Indole-3-glycerol phosphate synthase n=1 Tax=Halorhabdus tiamatea SARL4B TaxID=1033806 RepID=S6D854_9EURY|nr:indole-3-glycerol phosphate synthase [Halorhabdus tiamatea]ERJ04987.1 Indole-3-glycerol phosphate synthase protein [Halorhabdus tiamatea SARL4B]CCQ33231.1 indole-3-glycerol phosphate synthase [Halorhabdus tiamatea SARL4B]
MDSNEEIAPDVRSILSAARDRGGASGTVDVTARSLSAAFDRAERDGRVPTITEVKPTSPTTAGRHDGDPVELATAMVEHGAAALSVLTEPEHFGGSPETLCRVREAVDVPVLRKDFILYEEQLDVVEADLVLLIVRFLEEAGTDDLDDLIDAARDRGFQVLVEAHSRAEVEAAVEAGAEFVGVNNRDLAKLDVDLETFESVAPAVGDDVTLIAESGIETPADVRRMRAAGADGLLIGSAIMDGDVAANTQALTTPTETHNQ